ncbi:MAG: YncE family protein [Nitrospirota bacterium]
MNNKEHTFEVKDTKPVSVKSKYATDTRNVLRQPNPPLPPFTKGGRGRLMLFALCSLLLLGCASVKEYTEPKEPSEGQIVLFLKGTEKPSTNITFELTAVKIMADDGTYKDIVSDPIRVNSITIAGRQLLLSEKYLPEGNYKKLQLAVKEASIKRKDRTATLALPAEGIVLDIDLTIKRDQSAPLFLNWNADASVEDVYLFRPVFSITGQVPELGSLLVYVTNENSNNVSVINRQTGDVVATILVGKKPRGVAAGTLRERPRIYVSNSGSDSISVIDPTLNKIDVEIPIRFGKQPEGIAAARVSANKELIFVTNYGSDNVSVIDAATYQEMEKINVGRGPIAVAVDPPAETQSRARFLSFEDINLLRDYGDRFFNVYVANRNSREVSVIKMDRRESRAVEVINLSVEWSPLTITVDSQRGKIYVGNYDYDGLSVIDVLQIIRGNTAGAVSSITNVGTSVVGILADPDLDRIYLLREITGEILIIRPFGEALIPQRPTMVMSPVIDRIPVGNSPRSLVLDPEGRTIYVVNRGSNTVSVINKTTKRREKVIPVGKKPYGIAMFPF